MDGDLKKEDDATPDDSVKSALDAYHTDKEDWSENYKEFEADLDFGMNGNQWDEEALRLRRAKKMPAETCNLLPQFIHQVENSIRMNTPSMEVSPIDSGADVETAEILEGVLRNIQQQSRAKTAYVTAASYAVKGGIGFFRLDHDYSGPDTFEQHALVREVADPMSVVIDSGSTAWDGSDMTRGFIIDQWDKADFEKKFPGAAVSSFEGNGVEIKKEGGVVCLAEYFKRDEEEIEVGLWQQQDGSALTLIIEDAMGLGDPLQRRTIKRNKVRRCLMSGSEILIETVFPSSWIPIIPVYGEMFWHDGKRKLKSLIRNAKGPQRMYNYWKSTETYLLSKSPKAPFIAMEGATEDFPEWKNPDLAEVLRHKKGSPQPARQSPPMISAGVLNAANQCIDQIKACMGMYDASIGNRTNETSGRAIGERKQEGQVNTFHFGDNLVRSVEHAGRVCLDIVQRTYDTKRLERIIGRENDVKMVGINGAFMHGQQKRHFDLSTGRYDVAVTAGPDFTTKRKETVAVLGDAIRSNPDLMKYAGDLLFKAMDVPGSQEIAARLKRSMPPNIVGDEKDAPDPEKQQMAQTLEQLQKALLAADQQVQQLEGQLKQNKADTAIKAEEVKIKGFEAQTSRMQAQGVLRKNEQDFALGKQKVKVDTLAVLKPEPFNQFQN